LTVRKVSNWFHSTDDCSTGARTWTGSWPRSCPRKRSWGSKEVPPIHRHALIFITLTTFVVIDDYFLSHHCDCFLSSYFIWLAAIFILLWRQKP